MQILFVIVLLIGLSGCGGLIIEPEYNPPDWRPDWNHGEDWNHGNDWNHGGWNYGGGNHWGPHGGGGWGGGHGRGRR